MELFTASSLPILVKVDGQDYVAEKITVGDLQALAHLQYMRQLEALRADYADKPDLEKERLEKESALRPAPPYELLPYLLNTFEGMTLVLWTALRKKQPHLTYEWAAGLTFSDDMVQVCYDLMDIRRRVVAADNIKKNEPNPANPPATS